MNGEPEVLGRRRSSPLNLSLHRMTNRPGLPHICPGLGLPCWLKW